MNPDRLSTLLCRAIGLLLLVLGVSSVLPVFIFGIRSGWTSYAGGPQVLTFTQQAVLFLRYYLPYGLQAFVGVGLLLFSRPLGRLLSRGLFDHAA